MITFTANSHQEGFEKLFEVLATRALGAPEVDTGHWQAMKNMPQTQTKELHNVALEVPIPPTSGSLASYIRPNLPWAEDHFQERVGGEPLNPGEQYKNWPYYRGNVEKHQTVDEVKFSHSYMERIWPKHAGFGDVEVGGVQPTHRGIRYLYGDLNDVLDLLGREPHTRQAYLPLWFPEDTGAHHGERVPCTLGYHFLLRDEKLHCFYPIRSCDLLRHFRDDVYMAGRLVQWVIAQMKAREPDSDPDNHDQPALWYYVQPGDLTMFIPSLHIFQGDVPSLQRKYGS